MQRSIALTARFMNLQLAAFLHSLFVWFCLALSWFSFPSAPLQRTSQPLQPAEAPSAMEYPPPPPPESYEKPPPESFDQPPPESYNQPPFEPYAHQPASFSQSLSMSSAPGDPTAPPPDEPPPPTFEELQEQEQQQQQQQQENFLAPPVLPDLSAIDSKKKVIKDQAVLDELLGLAKKNRKIPEELRVSRTTVENLEVDKKVKTIATDWTSFPMLLKLLITCGYPEKVPKTLQGHFPKLQALSLVLDAKKSAPCTELAGPFPELRSLCIQGLSLEGPEVITKALLQPLSNSIMPNLTELTLYSTGMTSEDFVSLVTTLAAGSGQLLTKIDIYSEEVEDSGCIALGSAMQKGKFPCLKQLILSSTSIGSAGARSLAKALEIKACEYIEHIELRGNAIGDQGCTS